MLVCVLACRCDSPYTQLISCQWEPGPGPGGCQRDSGSPSQSRQSSPWAESGGGAEEQARSVEDHRTSTRTERYHFPLDALS
jgi:hypothetical protein